MESVTLTRGGLPTILRHGAEVSRSHSRSATSPVKPGRPHKRTEGRNVRMAKKLGSL